MSKSVDDGTRLFGRSRTIQTLLLKVSRVAVTRVGVLIVGESGAGKRHRRAAPARHELRRRGPFVPVIAARFLTTLRNRTCSVTRKAVSPAPLPSTSACSRPRGGTLFLDEIAEMPAELQVKLLRTLESNTIVRVGGHESIPLDVRIVAATHHDPVEAVRSGRLREDLFYRIATVALHARAQAARGRRRRYRAADRRAAECAAPHEKTAVHPGDEGVARLHVAR